MEDFENLSESVQGLQEELRDQATDVCEQLQNIHIKGKKQSCEMRLVWENLVEMDKDNDKPPMPKVDTEKQRHPLPSLVPFTLCC